MSTEIEKEISKTNILTDDIYAISENILLSKNAEKNYYAVLKLGINKTKHLQVVIESKEPLYNFKCIKHCTKTSTLTPEEKKYFITKHIDIVLNSNNEKLIKELKNFLKYNRSQENKPKVWDNSKKHSKRRI